MLEDFEAILGTRLDSTCQIIVPPVQTPNLHSIQYQMARMFNFPPQSSFQYSFGNKIMMSSLLEVIMATNNTEVHWLRMLAFCIYAQFLSVSPFGNCDSKILKILGQVEAGLNPFPLILAEIIISLDNFLELGDSLEVRCSWRLAFSLNPSFSTLSVHLYLFQYFHTGMVS